MKQFKIKSWGETLTCIPCSLTLGNMLCGLCALMYMVGGHSNNTFPVPSTAIWFVFAGMLFDSLDGFAARKLNAESLHGMQLDSLSDMLTFGIVPAVLIYLAGESWWDTSSSPLRWINWAAAGFYASCTLWRLAYYNVSSLTENHSKDRFSGLPSPGAALGICSVMLLLNRIDLSAQTMAFVAVAYAFILGFLMVSSVEYMHAKKIVTSGPAPLRALLLILIIWSLIQFGPFALAALVHLYILSGPLSEVLLKNDEEAIDRLP
ncbi:CDP-alcohol phosphatidyltransferase family protein [Pontiellaceae bacterium B12219]|nr:CDP-alcohol phosphatidyltransferase family protein [Pontiellaceae bacterium B12219]